MEGNVKKFLGCMHDSCSAMHHSLWTTTANENTNTKFTIVVLTKNVQVTISSDPLPPFPEGMFNGHNCSRAAIRSVCNVLNRLQPRLLYYNLHHLLTTHGPCVHWPSVPPINCLQIVNGRELRWRHADLEAGSAECRAKGAQNLVQLTQRMPGGHQEPKRNCTKNNRCFHPLGTVRTNIFSFSPSGKLGMPMGLSHPSLQVRYYCVTATKCWGSYLVLFGVTYCYPPLVACCHGDKHKDCHTGVHCSEINANRWIANHSSNYRYQWLFFFLPPKEPLHGNCRVQWSEYNNTTSKSCQSPVT